MCGNTFRFCWTLPLKNQADAQYDIFRCFVRRTCVNIFVYLISILIEIPSKRVCASVFYISVAIIAFCFYWIQTPTKRNAHLEIWTPKNQNHITYLYVLESLCLSDPIKPTKQWKNWYALRFGYFRAWYKIIFHFHFQTFSIRFLSRTGHPDESMNYSNRNEHPQKSIKPSMQGFKSTKPSIHQTPDNITCNITIIYILITCSPVWQVYIYIYMTPPPHSHTLKHSNTV